MSGAIIQTNKLSKAYGTGVKATKALIDLDLSVHQGEIFGYLGPNGAGKTTTIRLLLDFIRPTQGDAKIFGLDVRADYLAIHRRVGYLPSELQLWKHRTAHQVVVFIASIRGDLDAQLAHADVLAERLKLDMSKRIRDYSTGNKRKLGLVLALMHKPELLILDEPTSGLDPLMQQTFNEMMREARNEGRTVFLSSHLLSEVQAICDRVAILRDGTLREVASVEHLTQVGYRKVIVEIDSKLSADMVERIKALGVVRDVTVNEHRLHLQLVGDFDPLMRILSDVYVKDIKTADPTLEEIFLAYYGNGTTEGK